MSALEPKLRPAFVRRCLCVYPRISITPSHVRRSPLSAAERTEYSYDPLGRVSGAYDYTGSTAGQWTSTSYDPISGQVATASAGEGTVTNSTIHYEYDRITGRHSRTWTSNNDTSYSYDRYGRLEHVTVNLLDGRTLAVPQVTTYSYDADGNTDTVVQDNGTVDTSDDLVHDYGYDDLNRLSSLTVTRGSTSLFAQSYTLAPDGQRTSSTETLAGVITYTSWSYDPWNRLTDEFIDVGNGSSGDPTHAMAPNSAGDEHISYSFDPVGNRLSKPLDDYDTAKDPSAGLLAVEADLCSGGDFDQRWRGMTSRPGTAIPAVGWFSAYDSLEGRVRASAAISKHPVRRPEPIAAIK